MTDASKPQHAVEGSAARTAGGISGGPEGAAPQQPGSLSSLAVKFAWRIALALVVLLALFGLVVALLVRAEINDQIDGSGARIVNALAAVDMQYWKAARDGRDYRMEVWYSKTNPEAPPRGREEMRLKDNPLRDAITMTGLDTSGIINVIITDRPNLRTDDSVQKAEIVLSYETLQGSGGTAKFDRERPYLPRGARGNAVKTDIYVADDEFTEFKPGGGREKYAVRQFRKTIVDRDGRATGNVILFLSAGRIDEVTSRFVTYVIIACVAALVAAVGFSFLLAALVTRPVRRLVHDMNVVSRGDLNHRAFGYKSDEVGLLAQTFNRMTRRLREAQKGELERRALARELEIAQEIQRALLPSSIPEFPGMEAHAVYRPAREIGGDYYDFIPIDGRHWGIMIADVSGKGVPGSMVMTMVRSLIRYEARGNISPADTLRKTNEIIARDIKKGMFVTAFYAVVDLERRSLKMSCAGHNPMLYWHEGTATIRTIKPGGLALGVVSGAMFDDELQEVVVNMEPNDRVVLYTDGITEAMNAQREEFGMERLARRTAAMASFSAGEFSSAIVSEVDGFCAGAEQHDDITMVNLRLLR